MNNLIDIIKQLEVVLMANPIYNTFNYGSIYDIDEMDVKYPAIFLNYLVNDITISKNTTVFNFQIIWYEKLKLDNSDMLQIHNDTTESCKDFVKYITDNQDELGLYFTDTTLQMKPFIEEWNDNCAGCICSIALTKTGSGNSCDNLNK